VRCLMSGDRTMSDSRGYSFKSAKAIQAGDKTLVGVQLGKFCLNKDIPVAEVAAAMEVSRQTVYSWFTGQFRPSKVHKERLESLLAQYLKDRI